MCVCSLLSLGDLESSPGSSLVSIVDPTAQEIASLNANSSLFSQSLADSGVKASPENSIPSLASSHRGVPGGLPCGGVLQVTVQ